MKYFYFGVLLVDLIRKYHYIQKYVNIIKSLS